MFSYKIESQAFVTKILTSHIEKNRLAHTYLFTGKKGSGKEDVAIAFACALNTDKKKYFKDDDSVSTKKILAGNHPDLYIVGSDEKTRSIKIEEIRGALSKASLKPYEGKWKVYIVKGADRLTLEAANSLLKTLEEPPAQTIFILLAESRSHLLETIQSRSFEIRFRPLASTDEEDMLVSPDALREMGRSEWEVFFEVYEKKPRDEFKALLDALLRYFRQEMEEAADPESSTPWRLSQCLEAIDHVTETKEAIASNANQKLAISRLTMQLKRSYPIEKVAV